MTTEVLQEWQPVEPERPVFGPSPIGEVLESFRASEAARAGAERLEAPTSDEVSVSITRLWEVVYDEYQKLCGCHATGMDCSDAEDAASQVVARLTAPPTPTRGRDRLRPLPPPWAADLHQMREAAGMSLDDAARVIWATPQYVNDIELGRAEPTPAMVERLKAAYAERAQP